MLQARHYHKAPRLAKCSLANCEAHFTSDLQSQSKLLAASHSSTGQSLVANTTWNRVSTISTLGQACESAKANRAHTKKITYTSSQTTDEDHSKCKDIHTHTLTHSLTSRTSKVTRDKRKSAPQCRWWCSSSTTLQWQQMRLVQLRRERPESILIIISISTQSRAF